MLVPKFLLAFVISYSLIYKEVNGIVTGLPNFPPTTPTPQPTYCCANRNVLIDQASPNSSELIQSFYTAFLSNGLNSSYPYKWGPAIKNEWIAMMNQNWTTVIGNPNLTLDQIHEQIYDYAIGFITDKVSTNKTYVLCVIDNGWGYFGEYLQCQVNDGSSPPAYPLQCKDWYNNNPNWTLPYPCAPTTLLATTTTTTVTTTPPPYCCTNRDILINQANPNASELIQSFYSAYTTKGTNTTSYPFKWGPTIWNQWTAMMNVNWTTVIGSPSLTNEQKYQQLYAYAINFITNKLSTNKSYVVCVQENNWGFFGDFLQCAVNDGAPPPSFSLNCKGWVNNATTFGMPAYSCPTITSLAPTTIIPVTTTIKPTTTVPLTPTIKPTTTPQATTNFKPTTTVPVTMTIKPTTTVPLTASIKPTITIPLTTVIKHTTTVPLTTTNKPTITPHMTTTIKQTTTILVATTIKPSTTPIVTTIKPTISPPVATTTKPTTTIPKTTTIRPTSTVPMTTTIKPTTTIHATTTSNTTYIPTTSKFSTIMQTTIAAVCYTTNCETNCQNNCIDGFCAGAADAPLSGCTCVLCPPTSCPGDLATCTAYCNSIGCGAGYCDSSFCDCINCSY